MRNRRAMTMVEVLVTLVVIVSIIGPIFAALHQATRRVYRGGDETLATIYGREVLETIRGAPYTAFSPNDQPMNPEQIFREHNIPEGVDISKYPDRYSIEATVSPVEGYHPTEMKRVKVVVAWNDRTTKKPKNAVFATFYRPTR
jgi:type II secretory pathway pseudopilin PulG